MLNSLALESLCIDLFHCRPQAVMPGGVQYLSVNSEAEGLRDRKASCVRLCAVR